MGEEETQVEKRLLVGDLWFGSVRSAVKVAQQGHHAVLAVKTAHSRFPKKFLDDTMKEFPGGTWITMRGKCGRTGVELVAIGYKDVRGVDVRGGNIRGVEVGGGIFVREMCWARVISAGM